MKDLILFSNQVTGAQHVRTVASRIAFRVTDELTETADMQQLQQVFDHMSSSFQNMKNVDKYENFHKAVCNLLVH